MDVDPAAPDFLTRHPQLTPHQEPSGHIVISLGPNAELVPALEQAARAYTPPGRYQGAR